MDTFIDFSHTADTGDNERVFLASPASGLVSYFSRRSESGEQIELTGLDTTD